MALSRILPRAMSSAKPFLWKIYIAELIGTALLISVGLSVVILDFGQSSPMISFLPDASLRRLITGFLFGATGALIAISPLGKESGAHINPVVTLGFWIMGRFKARHVLGYIICQLAGAIIGGTPLLAWGALGLSVEYGATVPGYGDGWALVGEVVTTLALVFLLFYFLRHKSLKHCAPALLPRLYALMVWLEAPVSGTSTNPARSLGPAVIADEWRGWWTYWLRPLIGTLIAVAVHRENVLRLPQMKSAKVHHLERDPHGVFHN